MLFVMTTFDGLVELRALEYWAVDGDVVVGWLVLELTDSPFVLRSCCCLQRSSFAFVRCIWRSAR